MCFLTGGQVSERLMGCLWMSGCIYYLYPSSVLSTMHYGKDEKLAETLLLNSYNIVRGMYTCVVDKVLDNRHYNSAVSSCLKAQEGNERSAV